MAHDHEHPHDSTYYLDQLCTIAACGALGAVAVLMYCLRGADGKPKLEYILAPQFFTPVLIGGIALLVLVAIRALTLWQEAGKNASHVHDHHQHDHDHHHHDHDHHHDHGHDHDHAQAHAHHHDHDHDHAHAHVHAHNHAHAHDDHGHEHGWTPARYAVLMFPIVLYFLGWPNSSFSNDWAKNALMQGALEGPNVELQDKGRIELGFKDLEKAAFDPVARQEYEGKTGVLQGMFSPQQSDKEFTLYRVKINCCAADAVPLQVRIICADNITRFKAQQWVEVEGQIQFRKVASTNKYLPVMMLKSADQVKGIPPKPDYSLD